jgi:hypothetical protein
VRGEGGGGRGIEWKNKIQMLTFLPIKSVVGSYRNVSRMVISVSSFCRSTLSVSSHDFRNGPTNFKRKKKETEKLAHNMK